MDGPTQHDRLRQVYQGPVWHPQGLSRKEVLLARLRSGHSLHLASYRDRVHGGGDTCHWCQFDPETLAFYAGVRSNRSHPGAHIWVFIPATFGSCRGTGEGAPVPPGTTDPVTGWCHTTTTTTTTTTTRGSERRKQHQKPQNLCQRQGPSTNRTTFVSTKRS